MYQLVYLVGRFYQLMLTKQVKPPIGYVTSFKDNPNVDGVQIDLMGGYMAAFAGISTDIHQIDGELKANWAAIVNGSIPVLPLGSLLGYPEVSLRYVFKNNTGVQPFSFGFGLGAGTYLD